ncbi:MAG: hypothetical protein ACN4GW_05070 [Desulforhopalus sp.]
MSPVSGKFSWLIQERPVPAGTLPFVVILISIVVDAGNGDNRPQTVIPQAAVYVSKAASLVIRNDQAQRCGRIAKT